VKLGLAKIVTLVALYRLNTRYAFCVLIPRCVLGAVFGGGITGLLFSLTGGILALLVMAVAKKSELFSIYGVSVLGAAAHSIGQILAAMALMGSVYIGAYLTWLLLVSLFTGLAIGMLCHAVLRGLKLGGTL
jgi:heptaprenyl diphosphate synthase